MTSPMRGGLVRCGRCGQRFWSKDAADLSVEASLAMRCTACKFARLMDRCRKALSRSR